MYPLGLNLIEWTATASIATVVLAVGAVITSIFAIRAFGKQSAELTTLKDQVDDQRETNKKLAAAAELQAQELRESLDERKREQAQQHRAQADQVYVTLEKSPGNSPSAPNDAVVGRMAQAPLITATVRNYSQQIIREVQLRWHDGSGASFGEPNPEPVGELIPQAVAERERKFLFASDLERCGAVVIFQDAAGTLWLRRPDGDLQEQS